MSEAEKQAVRQLCAACEELRREHENPVPDAIYRDVLRRRIFARTAEVRKIIGDSP